MSLLGAFLGIFPISLELKVLALFARLFALTGDLSVLFRIVFALSTLSSFSWQRFVIFPVLLNQHESLDFF